jgi:tRNA pseudouridine38-40 synthase
VDVGRGRLSPDATLRGLQSRSRTDLGVTAPPEGLYLDEIVLDAALSETWPQVDGSRTVT